MHYAETCEQKKQKHSTANLISHRNSHVVSNNNKFIYEKVTTLFRFFLSNVGRKIKSKLQLDTELNIYTDVIRTFCRLQSVRTNTYTNLPNWFLCNYPSTSNETKGKENKKTNMVNFQKSTYVDQII